MLTSSLQFHQELLPQNENQGELHYQGLLCRDRQATSDQQNKFSAGPLPKEGGQ